MKKMYVLLALLLTNLVYAEPTISWTDSGSRSGWFSGFSGPAGYPLPPPRQAVPPNPTHFSNGAPFCGFQSPHAREVYLNSHQIYQGLIQSPNNAHRNLDAFIIELDDARANIRSSQFIVARDIPGGANIDSSLIVSLVHLRSMRANVESWIEDTELAITERNRSRPVSNQPLRPITHLSPFFTDQELNRYNQNYRPSNDLNYDEGLLHLYAVECPDHTFAERQSLIERLRIHRETLAPGQMHRAPSPTLERSYPELALVPLLQRALLPVSETIIEIGTALAEYRDTHDYPTIRIPYGEGTAVQDMSPEALEIRGRVDNGATLYRIGTRATSADPTRGSNTGDRAQFWSPESPNNPGYAERYGIPPENLARVDFIERAVMRPNSSYVVRQAPGVGTNSGGAYEIVIPEAQGSIEMQSHGSF